jgi:hypothetical protein
VFGLKGALLLDSDLLLLEVRRHPHLVKLRLDRAHYFLDVFDVHIKLVAFLKRERGDRKFRQYLRVYILLSALQI